MKVIALHMPLSAALELLFGVCVAKVSAEGDSSRATGENFILLGGVSPSAAVWEHGCPANQSSHGQDCIPNLPMLFLREQLNLNLAFFHVLHQPKDYPPGVPSSPQDLLWHLGRVARAE